MKYATDPFDEGLSFHHRLAVSWQPLTELPDSTTLLKLNHRNYSLLQSLLLNDERILDVEAELEPLAIEIGRLDQKMTLLTELLSDLLRSQALLPAERLLRIGAKGVSWEISEDELQQGQLVKLDLYLLDDVPRPLQFTGLVVGREPSRTSSDCRITVSFVELSESVDSLMGRLIFRHHRREIAMARMKAE